MFNALKYTEELEKAGFTRQQAEISVKVLIEVMNDNFATKSDLKDANLVLRADLREMETVLRSDMREMDASLRTEISRVETTLRAEIRDVESRLGNEIRDVETKLSTEIRDIRASVKELEYKLTIKLGTMMTVAVGVTATLVRLLAIPR